MEAAVVLLVEHAKGNCVGPLLDLGDLAHVQQARARTLQNVVDVAVAERGDEPTHGTRVPDEQRVDHVLSGAFE